MWGAILTDADYVAAWGGCWPVAPLLDARGDGDHGRRPQAVAPPRQEAAQLAQVDLGNRQVAFADKAGCCRHECNYVWNRLWLGLHRLD
jgi:hypothetical protein